MSLSGVSLSGKPRSMGSFWGGFGWRSGRDLKPAGFLCDMPDFALICAPYARYLSACELNPRNFANWFHPPSRTDSRAGEDRGRQSAPLSTCSRLTRRFSTAFSLRIRCSGANNRWERRSALGLEAPPLHLQPQSVTTRKFPVSFCRTHARFADCIAAFYNHALVRRARGARRWVAEVGGSAGGDLPRLLVSALCLRAPLRTYAARRPRPHTGVLCPLARKALARRCGSRQGPTAHFFYRGDEELHGERVAPRGSPAARRTGRALAIGPTFAESRFAAGLNLRR